jgi:hypothetical protein
MGENAKKTWDWHNTVVGVGYQAKGVVRQRVSEEPAPIKVKDMRGPVEVPDAQKPSKKEPEVTKTKDKEEKKAKKKKDSRKHKKRHDSDESSDDQSPPSKRSKFNPLLQALSVRLRDNLQPSAGSK